MSHEDVSKLLREGAMVRLEVHLAHAICVRGALAEAIKAISATGRWDGVVATGTGKSVV